MIAQNIKYQQSLFTAFKPLAKKSAENIPDRKGHISKHDGPAGIQAGTAIHGFCKTIALVYQDADHKPGRQTDQDGIHIFPEADPVCKKHKKITSFEPPSVLSG